MTSNFLLPSISLPTRMTNNSGTLIDNIFTNSINPDAISGNLTIGISDHLPSIFIVPKPNQNHLPKKHNLFTRNLKNINSEVLFSDLNNIDWNEELKITEGDINSSFNKFHNIIDNILDIHAPLRKLSRKEYKQKFKPWIISGILVSIKRKHVIFNKYIKCADPMRKKAFHTEYKHLRNNLNKIIEDSKKLYYTNFFHNNNKNLKKVWQGIKEIINIKTKNQSVPSCIIQDEQTHSDPQVIAEKFNNYFSTIADSILKDRKYEGNKSFHDFLPSPLTNSFVFTPVDELEIQKIICQLNKNKASGPYSIPTIILQSIKNIISKPLCDLINFSFTSGAHPDLLKIAKSNSCFQKRNSSHHIQL